MKGISPLLATMLLISITIFVATILMNWSSLFVTTTAGNSENKSEEVINCFNGGINIDDVYLTTGSSGTARAIITNTGTLDHMRVSKAVLLTNLGNNYTITNTGITDFNRGDVATITFSGINVPACANFSKVIVTSSCGATYSFQKLPKGCI